MSAMTAPPLTTAELAWIDAGEAFFRTGPEVAKLPPLDDRRLQRLWLGGFAMAWLDASEPIAAAQDDPIGWLYHDDARAALAARLADHPALLAKLNAIGPKP